MATAAQPMPREGTHRWSVMIGEHDTLHDPADVRAYWRAVLPDARFMDAEGAGRLLALADPGRVAQALSEISYRRR